jgi:hypothetical protein
MKAKTFRVVSVCVALLAAARVAGAGAATEELAVVQVVAKLLAGETTRPYDYLYFESVFSARKHVVASMSDPDRTQFCGLSRDEATMLVKQISFLNTEPVEFDKRVAKDAGLSLGHKQFPKFRYLKLSRVVFGSDNLRAWLAADLNGESGALYRLDKVNGAWNASARCAGWVKAGE